MTDDLVGQLRRDRELYGLELWPGYERQSWPERFAELDRQTSARCSTLQNAIIAMSAQHAARIEALEAENSAVRMMLADLHAATLTIATPKGSQLDEARDAAAAYFENRNHPHAD